MRFSDIPRPARYAARQLGQRNDGAIGGLLGRPPGEVERLKDAKAIRQGAPELGLTGTIIAPHTQLPRITPDFYPVIPAKAGSGRLRTP